jgi:hypothetical protein
MQSNSTPKAPAAIADGSEECLLFGVDVEKAGKLLTHSLMAVGFAVLSLSKGDIVASNTWCVGPPDDSNWEPRCIAEFWKDNIHVLNRIRAQGMPKQRVLQSVAEFLTTWEAKVKPSSSPGWQGGVVLVSDAPSFDESILNFEFQSLEDPVLENHTLHYTMPTPSRPSKWRSVEDCSERVAALGLPRTFFEKFFEQHNVVHDHWPTNDATKHAWTHAICYAVIQWLHEYADVNTSRNNLLAAFKGHMDAPNDGKRFICDLALKHHVVANS